LSQLEDELLFREILAVNCKSDKVYEKHSYRGWESGEVCTCFIWWLPGLQTASDVVGRTTVVGSWTIRLVIKYVF
jgi:hypothetical protein